MTDYPYDFKLIELQMKRLGYTQIALAAKTRTRRLKPLSKQVISKFLTKQDVQADTARRIIVDGLKLKMDDVLLDTRKSA